MASHHPRTSGRASAPERTPASRPPLTAEEGSTLLLALLVLGALSILATIAIVSSTSDRNISRYDRESAQALVAAENGIAVAQRALIERTAPMEDYDADGRPDFELSDSLAGAGSYHVIAEATELKNIDISAYQSLGFTILSEGRYHSARRRVKVEMAHDSYLMFARFSSQNDLAYDCNTVVTGQVYCGHNLMVPCGCGGGRECVFLEKAYVVGSVSGADCAQFMSGYEEHADSIDLNNSVNWEEIRNKSKGINVDNGCAGEGTVGIYINLPDGIDPLGLLDQTPPDDGVVVFDRFDYYNTTLSPPDTVMTYGGNTVLNTVTSTPLLTKDFNGIIFFEGDAKSYGTLDGHSAHSVTIYATNYNLVYNNIVTGHTGFDADGTPNGTGHPVNVGLVGDEYIGFVSSTPRVLRVDAALFSRKSDWRGLGNEADHPVVTGPQDLDMDGIVGETPVNNDPLPGEGWDEANPDENTWVLNLNGPIISTNTGDAKPWNLQNVINNADGPTRRYNYDMDIMDYPPPCFPLPIGLWHEISWTEIYQMHDALASHLPD